MLYTLNRLLLCVVILASINHLAFAKGTSDVQCRPVRDAWSFVKLREFSLQATPTASKPAMKKFGRFSNVARQEYFTPIYVVAWSPDNSRIAIGERDIYVWDVANDAFLTTLEPIPSDFPRENNRVEGNFGVGLAWSPDGSRIAAVYRDATIRIWDAENDWAMLVIPLERISAPSLVWSPDSTQIAAQGQVWDAQTGELLKKDIGGVYAGINTWYGVTLSASDENSLDIRNLLTDEIITIPTRGFVDMVWAEQGGRLMSLDVTVEPPFIQIWDLNTQHEIMRTEDKGFLLPNTQLSPTGTTFVIVRNDYELWDVASGELLYTVGNLVWSPDGTCFATIRYNAEKEQSDIIIRDIATGENIEFPTYVVITKVVFSPDGTMLASTSADGTLRIWGAAGD